MLKKIIVLLTFAFIYLFVVTVYGQEDGHGVRWDANTETNLAGYRIHYGPTVSGDYTTSVDVGNVLEYLFFTNPSIVDGLYYFAATAYDTDGKESPYSNELFINIDVTAEIMPLDGILDNDSLWTKEVGTWQVSSSTGFYGANSRYTNVVGNKYIFEADGISGRKEVFLWWTQHSKRCSNVSVQVYDGSNLIDTRMVDQSDQTRVSQWNALGLYTFIDTARVVINSQGTGGCTTSADAVKISNAPLLPPQTFRISGIITLTPMPE